MELGCPAEAGSSPVLYATLAGDSSRSRDPARRVSLSDLLCGTHIGRYHNFLDLPTAGTRHLGHGPPSPPGAGGQRAPEAPELAGKTGHTLGASPGAGNAAKAPHPVIDTQAVAGSIDATAVAASARASSA